MPFRTLSLWLVGLLAVALVSAAHAQTPVPAAPFTPEQTKAVERVIRDYLHAHPEFLVEILQEAKAKDRENKEQRAREALASERSALLDESTALVAGTPQGDA